MSGRASLRRYVGLAGGALGVVAAGAGAVVLAERRLVSRRRAETHSDLGALRGERRTVVADDGVELYAEVDEPAGPRRPATSPTLVFVHGYALNLDCWHFQRLALRGANRLVFYDQRSHGRSGRSSSEHSTIDQLGRDLADVIDQVVGEGPVILVGHSMGGMTIMAACRAEPGVVRRTHRGSRPDLDERREPQRRDSRPSRPPGPPSAPGHTGTHRHAGTGPAAGGDQPAGGLGVLLRADASAGIRAVGAG